MSQSEAATAAAQLASVAATHRASTTHPVSMLSPVNGVISVQVNAHGGGLQDLMQDARSPMSMDPRKSARSAANQARMQAMTPEERQAARRQEAERRASYRAKRAASMTPQQLAAMKAAEAGRRRKLRAMKRASMTEDQIREEKKREAQRRAKLRKEKRARMTPEQIAEEKARHAKRRAERRAELRRLQSQGIRPNKRKASALVMPTATVGLHGPSHAVIAAAAAAVQHHPAALGAHATTVVDVVAPKPSVNTGAVKLMPASAAAPQVPLNMRMKASRAGEDATTGDKQSVEIHTC